MHPIKYFYNKIEMNLLARHALKKARKKEEILHENTNNRKMLNNVVYEKII